jgi:hypothetical protein
MITFDKHLQAFEAMVPGHGAWESRGGHINSDEA